MITAVAIGKLGMLRAWLAETPCDDAPRHQVTFEHTHSFVIAKPAKKGRAIVSDSSEEEFEPIKGGPLLEPDDDDAGKLGDEDGIISGGVECEDPGERQMRREFAERQPITPVPWAGSSEAHRRRGHRMGRGKSRTTCFGCESAKATQARVRRGRDRKWGKVVIVLDLRGAYRTSRRGARFALCGMVSLRKPKIKNTRLDW